MLFKVLHADSNNCVCFSIRRLHDRPVKGCWCSFKREIEERGSYMHLTLHQTIRMMRLTMIWALVSINIYARHYGRTQLSELRPQIRRAKACLFLLCYYFLLCYSYPLLWTVGAHGKSLQDSNASSRGRGWLQSTAHHR